jgi:hypothetical protein
MTKMLIQNNIFQSTVKYPIVLMRVVTFLALLIAGFNYLPGSEASIKPANIDCQNLNFERLVGYNFKVADKLIGSGQVNISIKDESIFGTATGLGTTSKCMVDFSTSLIGKLDKSNGDIKVDLDGIADPIKIAIPGKVTFKGPLEGIFENGSLKLVGIVEVDGYLASCAGFEKSENVEIEISDAVLVKQFIELKQRASS